MVSPAPPDITTTGTGGPCPGDDVMSSGSPSPAPAATVLGPAGGDGDPRRVGLDNSGLLEPGDQLPTAQQVVAKLAINPNTVLKAYRDLEREGLVRPRPGQGTFVVGTSPATTPPPRPAFLTR